MNSLPASIEGYLSDAGFSATEILILRRLLEDDGMTLRQLAARVGKSTGVLDQAMRKLVGKGIVKKTTINGMPGFALSSLGAVVEWTDRDTKEKRDMLLRRHQNFETFIASVMLGKTRPDIRYYEGLEGIRQAYAHLLTQGNEFLHYLPVTCPAEEHPLSEFLTEYVRDRRRRGIFSRVISVDTPLGRRLQSRDPFDYHKTVLLPEEKFNCSFEKIIVGNVIACINLQKQTVCVITYPELAEMERSLFETLWVSAPHLNESSTPSVASKPPSISFTQFLVKFRDFFLSRSGLGIVGGSVLLSGLITLVLYGFTYHLNLQRVREKVIAIAATSATEFVASDLDELRTPEDVTKPVYHQITTKLDSIRQRNKNITFIYIARPTADGGFEFVAEADGIDPFAKIDSNDDGIFGGPEDEIVLPGRPYDVSMIEVLRDNKFQTPIANQDIYNDQWGSFMTGYAPIKDPQGNIHGVLAVDVSADVVDELTAGYIQPVLWFVLIFCALIVVFLAIFNRSLSQDLWHVFQIRSVVVTLLLCAELAYAVTFGLYWYTLQLMKNEIGTRLMSIATTAAPSFDPADLEQLHLPRDMKKEAYQRVFNRLGDIKNRNEDINFAYILRKTDQARLLEFVADADSNYFLLELGKDLNADGKLTDADENPAPGTQFYVREHSKFEEGFERPIYEEDFQVDQWGTWMSAYSPIIDNQNQPIAIIGVDMDIIKFREAVSRKFAPVIAFLGFFIIFLCMNLFFLSKN